MPRIVSTLVTPSVLLYSVASLLALAEGHFKAHKITPLKSATMLHRLHLSSADSGNSVANLMPPPAASLTRQLAVKLARKAAKAAKAAKVALPC